MRSEVRCCVCWWAYIKDGKAQRCCPMCGNVCAHSVDPKEFGSLEGWEPSWMRRALRRMPSPAQGPGIPSGGGNP